MNLNTFFDTNFKAFDEAVSNEILTRKFRPEKCPHKKKIDLCVGAKGAGKSTFVANLYEYGFVRVPYFDKKMIIKKYGQQVSSHAECELRANKVVNALAERLISEGRSFCVETDFEDTALLDTIISAKKHGYELAVHWVRTNDAQTNIERVQVLNGNVNAQKFMTSHEAMRAHIIRLIEFCNTLDIFDNSKDLTQTKERLKNPKKQIEKEKVDEGFCL